ncbi:MAG: CPBP family intramembrane metalloprotease [Acholeplasmatales bacterium]|jgi:membrane protease YdiL (CAAX protease family)|nr:CPBP family intramembrane metalloprotease [Acholeplasmatales bacterium]
MIDDEKNDNIVESPENESLSPASIESEEKNEKFEELFKIYEKKQVKTPYKKERRIVYCIALTGEIILSVFALILASIVKLVPYFYESVDVVEESLSSVALDSNGITFISELDFLDIFGETFLTYDYENYKDADKETGFSYVYAAGKTLDNYILIINISKKDLIDNNYFYNPDSIIVTYFFYDYNNDIKFTDGQSINYYSGILNLPSTVRNDPKFTAEILVEKLGDFYIHSVAVKTWVLSAINTICYLAILGILVVLLTRDIKEDFSDFKKEHGISSKIILGVLVTYGFSLFSGMLVRGLRNALKLGVDSSVNQNAIEEMLSNPVSLLLLIPAVCIVGPLVEELIFRKAIFGLINNFVVALIISSLFFGILHITSEETILLMLVEGISYVTMGFVFGYLYKKNNYNIITVWLIHALYNTVSVILSLLLIYS